jgi:uncharacterized membrane protein YhfC
MGQEGYRLAPFSDRRTKEYQVLSNVLIIQMVLLVAVPVALGLWFRRSLQVTWMLFLGGGLAYAVAWILTNFLPLPSELGLLVSSAMQIGALYLVYRRMLDTVNTEREALMVGVGQAGIELIILVVFLLLPTFVQMRNLRSANDATLITTAARSQGIAEDQVQPSDIDNLRDTIDEYWSTPWYIPLVQMVPLFVALPVQAALAVIVMYSIVRGSLQLLAGAIALHYLAKSLPIYASVVAGAAAWVALSVVIGAVAIWFLKRLWPTVQNQVRVAAKQQRAVGKRPAKA